MTRLVAFFANNSSARYNCKIQREQKIYHEKDEICNENPENSLFRVVLIKTVYE